MSKTRLESQATNYPRKRVNSTTQSLAVREFSRSLHNRRFCRPPFSIYPHFSNPDAPTPPIFDQQRTASCNVVYPLSD